jgi:hypothetical protein
MAKVKFFVGLPPSPSPLPAPKEIFDRRGDEALFILLTNWLNGNSSDMYCYFLANLTIRPVAWTVPRGVIG